MIAVFRNIDKVIASSQTVLKDDVTSTVIRVVINNQPMVIKRLNTKNPVHFFRRLFQKSRAQRNWHNTQYLKQAGIQTFEPIAILEERFGPLKRRSYFICSYIQGIKALEFFTQPDLSVESSEKVAISITDLFQSLSKCWISHRDLNLSNILLVGDQPWLIDLDSMQCHRWHFLATRSAKRELKRFIRNCQETPEVSKKIISLFQSLFIKCNM